MDQHLPKIFSNTFKIQKAILLAFMKSAKHLKMLHENQIYSVGSSGSVRIPLEQIADLLIICIALKCAVGENTSWKLWQYRIGSTPHVAPDIEGTAGLMSWKIIVNENLKFSYEGQICRGRDPVSEVNDVVDAFYFILWRLC